MASRKLPDNKLTPLETIIMNALWDQSPAAVKQVRERLKTVKPMAYSTVLTMMRILRDKGFLASVRQAKPISTGPSSHVTMWPVDRWAM